MTKWRERLDCEHNKASHEPLKLWHNKGTRGAVDGAHGAVVPVVPVLLWCCGRQGRLSPAGENEEGGLHPVEVDLQNIFQWILVRPAPWSSIWTAGVYPDGQIEIQSEKHTEQLLIDFCQSLIVNQ